MNKLVLAPALFLAAAVPSPAQSGGVRVAAVSASAQPASVAPGGHGVLSVTLAVGPRYHINANKPGDPAYIATVFSPQPGAGITYGPVRYPAARSVKVSYSPKPLLVYTGRAVISVPFTVAKSAAPGPRLLHGTVSFQGCDASSCFPPASAPVTARVAVR